MASTTFLKTGPGVGALRRALRGIGDWLVACIERQSRLDKVQRLQAKSDAELAEIGVRRQDIVRHVFSDRYFV